jgi:hypothetical protein
MLSFRIEILVGLQPASWPWPFFRAVAISFLMVGRRRILRPKRRRKNTRNTSLGAILGGRRDAAQLVDGRARLDRVDRAVRVDDVHGILHQNQRCTFAQISLKSVHVPE